MRFIFARTFRDYPISVAPVKVKRLTCLTPCRAVRVLPRPFCVERNSGKRQTLKDLSRAQLAGRLTAHKEFSRHAKPSTPLAMDCSVWLTVRPWRTECRTDPLRSLHNRITRTRPRSPATAINLVYFTMTGCESQTDGRRATGLMVREGREGPQAVENGAKLSKFLRDAARNRIWGAGAEGRSFRGLWRRD